MEAHAGNRFFLKSRTIYYAQLMSIFCYRYENQSKTKKSYFPYDTLHAVLQGVVLWQHSDYKMLDQTPPKRWDLGTFTGQTVAPRLSLSCHRATTEGSLVAEAYAVQRARSAVQLVEGTHLKAKHRKWQETCRHKFERIRFALCTCACLSFTVVRFQNCVIVWI